MMLSYTSLKTGTPFQADLKAAPRLSTTGTHALPRAIGTIRFHWIPDPKSFGIPSHPLLAKYPRLDVRYHLMVIEDQFVQPSSEPNGVPGVALWMNYNGSDFCATIESIQGRGVTAPWEWGTDSNDPLRDPRPGDYLQWRQIPVGDRFINWSNSLIHGWAGWNGEHSGADWLDGVAMKLATMYDRNLGTVGQSVMIPAEAPGLGLAEQTIAPEWLVQTYSSLVFFPKPEVMVRVERLRNIWKPERVTRHDDYQGMTKGPMMYGSTRGGDNTHESAPAPKIADLKMAVGGTIRQSIIPNDFSASFWDEPEVLFVCFPVRERTAARLLQQMSPREIVDGRRQQV